MCGRDKRQPTVLLLDMSCGMSQTLVIYILLKILGKVTKRVGDFNGNLDEDLDLDGSLEISGIKSLYILNITPGPPRVHPKPKINDPLGSPYTSQKLI